MVWTTRCPAKLNLFLAVGPKDSRGWHPLRTIFQAVSLFDTLTVSLAKEDGFATNVDYLNGENTLTKALRKYREAASTPPIEVMLEKSIPAQSGLGGGSSDAAGLIRILQAINPNPLSPGQLNQIAVEVGADVPFFLVGGRARAQGYGEIIEPLADSAEGYCVILKPDIDCPTAQMFHALDELSYNWVPFPLTSSQDIERYNDFERVMPDVCKDYIELLKLSGASSAGLTGSGSATYGIFPNHTAAKTGLELLKGTLADNVAHQAWICSFVNREDSLRLTCVA
jgi:4-diphosphocytidyl-2-C-methyl-D-erythritol kinase